MSDTRDLYKLFRELESQHQVNDKVGLHDSFDLELNEHFVIESGVVGLTEDGVIIQLDEAGLEFLDFNGMLTESEEIEEMMVMGADSDASSAGSKTLGEGSSRGVADAIRFRILNQHRDIVAKYGPTKIMAAIEDQASGLDDLEEIGSSDISIWTRQVIDDLEKGYYDDIDESALTEGSSQGVADSIRFRILNRHHDVIAKYGPVRIMAAIEDQASGLDDLEEIGSSDISIWTRQVIDDLEKGYYDDMDTLPVKRDVTETSADSDIFVKVVKSDDPFQVVYDGISGHFGEDARMKLQDIYDDVVIDHGFHPDDDFEKIIDIVIDHIEADYGEGGSQKPYWSGTSKDELAEIKKLALGHNEVDEGLGKALLGGAALIATIAGINKIEADHLMKTEPQLVTLTQMRQEASQKGDEAAVQNIDDRIQKTLDFISVKGRPVMGPNGDPVDPRKPIGEAEYQGRKVPLGKPMQGDVKKSKVYVKKPNGKVVKVNFGDKNMTIKKSNPARRKSFRARHNCENPGPKWKARYWSCRAW
jgi:hypothetical protein